MSLIKSISGIRGTIGGPAGDGLTPLDIVKFTAAYAKFIAATTTKTNKTIVVGRDARLIIVKPGISLDYIPYAYTEPYIERII